ncbi:LOW QUALITY PROTEIN: hypothetical protein MXB_3439 [Myxobolus squamalis]|nr:LOW QUALITY PROTEIN: hypothetical protein MXB_3439 [Myxobolus squamalis]
MQHLENYKIQVDAHNSNSEEMMQKVTKDYINDREDQYINARAISVFVMTWNIASTDLIANEELKIALEKVIKELPDLICLGFFLLFDPSFQEVDMSLTSIMLGDNVSRNMLEFEVYDSLPNSDHYYIVQSKHCGGLSMVLFAKNEFKCQIKSVCSTSMTLGPLSMVDEILLTANKGAVSFSVLTQKNSICFLCAHLFAHAKNFTARNDVNYHAYQNLNSKLSHKHDGDKGTLGVLDHDITYWFGDLNYRIDADSIPNLFSSMTSYDISSLCEFDQLLKSRKNNLAFSEFTEPIITFRPTYKFSLKKDTLAYDNNRPPAWCDRILYRACNESMIKLCSYISIEMPSSSDHLPVCAHFKNIIMFYDIKTYSEILNQAYSYASQIMAQREPKIQLSEQNFDFGDLHFYRKKTISLNIINIGPVNAMIVLNYSNYLPNETSKWIQFKPGLTTLKPGDSTTSFMDETTNLSISPIEPNIETIILLKLASGREYFLSFNAKFVRGCFGYPLELLIKYESPLKGGKFRTLRNMTLSLPLQVLAMTNYIRSNISLATVFYNKSAI